MEHQMLMFPAAGLAKALRVYCQGLRGAGSSWSAAVAAAAMKVLWQLHTTLSGHPRQHNRPDSGTPTA
jgi:hypothetical protein